MQDKFYVYMYSHPVTKVPFYVGKGSGDRYLKHLTDARNPYLKNKIAHLRSQRVEPIVEKVFHTNDENIAYDVEEHLIKSYGIKEQNGSLCNFLLGGRNGCKYDFDDDFYDRLGIDFDNEIANDYDCSVITVNRIRNSLGIKKTSKKTSKSYSENHSPWNKQEFPEDYKYLLGEISDVELGNIIGCSSSYVGKYRRSVGIVDFYKSNLHQNWRMNKRDSRIHSLHNEKTGESFMGIRIMFKNYIKCSSGQLSDVISGKNKSVKGWKHLGVLNE